MRERSETIHVIVPIFAMQGELQRLESWLSRITPGRFRIFLIDDFTNINASTEIDAVAKKYGHLDISIFSNRYASPGKSRNAGLRAVSEGWVVFWDADDTPIPEMIEKATIDVDKSADILIGNYSLQSYQSSFAEYSNFASRPPNWSAVIRNPGVWRFAFRREIIGEIEFPEYLLGEDQIFLASVLTKNPKISFSRHHFYTYTTGRANSLTNNREYDRMKELRLALKHMGTLVSKNSEFKFIVALLYLKMSITLLRESLKKSES